MRTAPKQNLAEADTRTRERASALQSCSGRRARNLRTRRRVRLRGSTSQKALADKLPVALRQSATSLAQPAETKRPCDSGEPLGLEIRSNLTSAILFTSATDALDERVAEYRQDGARTASGRRRLLMMAVPCGHRSIPRESPANAAGKKRIYTRNRQSQTGSEEKRTAR